MVSTTRWPSTRAHHQNALLVEAAAPQLVEHRAEDEPHPADAGERVAGEQGDGGARVPLVEEERERDQHRRRENRRLEDLEDLAHVTASAVRRVQARLPERQREHHQHDGQNHQRVFERRLRLVLAITPEKRVK
jgi:hypothetical protein